MTSLLKSLFRRWRYRSRKMRLTKMGIRLPQNDKEFFWLCSIFDDMHVKKYLEIGSREGGSLFVIAGMLEAGAHVVAVDLPGAQWGRRGSQNYLNEVTKLIRREGLSVDILLGDSHSETTHQRVRGLADEQAFDALFIDGDHSYEGVSRDWEMYSPFVRPGGVVAFHDLIISDEFPDVGVGHLFEELKENHEWDARQELYGIGVVWK